MPEQSLREVYDKIAPTRYNLHHWTRFKDELDKLAERWGGGKLLNLGCGHGPEFLPFADKKFELFGVDFSAEMLKLAEKFCRKNGCRAELAQADIRNLPFQDASFDYAVSAATYHHLDTAAGREQAFRELWRILKPGGEAFITVWNRWRPQRNFSPLSFWFMGKEAIVPWKVDGETLQRYYYFFTYGEIERLVRRAGFKVLRTTGESSHRGLFKFTSHNICLLIKKPL